MNNLFNSPSLLTQNQKTQATPSKKSSNFVEALKDQVGAATTGVLKNAIDQLSNQATSQNQENQAPKDFNFAEYLKLKENKIRQQERTLHQQQQRVGMGFWRL